MGDFCMEPNTNLLNIVDQLMGGADDSNSPSSTYTMVKTFMDCQGVNPLNNFLSSSESDITQMAYLLGNYTQDYCPQNTNLHIALDIIPNIAFEVNTLFSYISCPPVKDSLYSLLNIGFCTDTVTGVYTIWVGLFVFSGFLFFLNFTAGIMVQYFNPIMWNMSPNAASPGEYPVVAEKEYEGENGDGNGQIEMSKQGMDNL